MLCASPLGVRERLGLQGRLAQDLRLEAEAARHASELQQAELQQRLRLSEEACGAAREDAARLKQEQREDARMMEVQPCLHAVSQLCCGPPPLLTFCTMDCSACVLLTCLSAQLPLHVSPDCLPGLSPPQFYWPTFILTRCWETY